MASAWERDTSDSRVVGSGNSGSGVWANGDVSNKKQVTENSQVSSFELIPSAGGGSIAEEFPPPRIDDLRWRRRFPGVSPASPVDPRISPHIPIKLLLSFYFTLTCLAHRSDARPIETAILAQCACRISPTISTRSACRVSSSTSRLRISSLHEDLGVIIASHGISLIALNSVGIAASNRDHSSRAMTTRSTPGASAAAPAEIRANQNV